MFLLQIYNYAALFFFKKKKPTKKAHYNAPSKNWVRRNQIKR